MRRIAITCVILLAAITGCAVVDWIFGEPGSYYSTYERSYPPVGYSRGHTGTYSPWIGRHSEELVESLGQPDIILEARPKFADYRDGIPKISYVYRAEPGDGVARSACIDAYVVLQATGQIVDYYCR